MEDVLEVYAEPYDPTRPKVNFDETTKQLIQETGSRCRLSQGGRSAMMMKTSATARVTFFSSWNRRPAGGMCK
jgi:hypothetical protein